MLFLDFPFEIKFFEQATKSARAFFLEIVHVSLTVGYYLEEAAAGTLVFLVFLEVSSQFFDPFGQKRDLHLG